MDKVLAIAVLIVFVWWAYPHIARSEWIAPALVPTEWWGLQSPYLGAHQVITPPTSDYDWNRFDIWNQL